MSRIDFGIEGLCKIECENCGKVFLGSGGEDTEDKCTDCLGF